MSDRKSAIGDWFDERTGYRGLVRGALEEPVPGGASFAYAFGSVLTILLVLQGTTGVLLALYYSPSASDAWASVAYIEDQVTLGWFVRGLHSHGASALVIISGLHLLQTALYGAYKKPRELNWIVGVMLLGVLLAFALTGYLLPWDQTGFWATKVATGIAGTSPVVGEALQAGIQGGNEYGNLTLTRFFAIHVFVLPVALVGLVVGHIALFRKHGVTPHWRHSDKQLADRMQPFWPDQVFRDIVVAAIAIAGLVAVNLWTGGAGLDGPADPTSNFDARPEWYFRPLFQMLKYFEGPLEQVVSLGIPPVVGGALFALPFLDRGASRNPLKRLRYLAVIGVLVVGAGALTVLSFAEDGADNALAEREHLAHQEGLRARELAKTYGVPPAGGVAVYTMDPKYAAQKLFADECAGCHQGDKRSGPKLGPGYNSRAWIEAFLKEPGGDLFFGVTKDHEMEPVDLPEQDLKAVVELIYAQTGASDADAKLARAGQELFDDGECSSCHSLDDNSEGDTGPNLWKRGSEAMIAEFIANPGHDRWFGEHTEMPKFSELSSEQRGGLAKLIVSWQRVGSAQAQPAQ